MGNKTFPLLFGFCWYFLLSNRIFNGIFGFSGELQIGFSFVGNGGGILLRMSLEVIQHPLVAPQGIQYPPAQRNISNFQEVADTI
jgi:hypothetical protein